MIKIKKLSNKISFFHLRTTETDNRITIVLAVKSGSFFEPKNQNGISHLLEHLLINSKNKLKPYQSIHEYLDEMDSTFNATIRKEYTVYVLNFPQQKMGPCLKFLEKLLRLDFNQNDLEREKRIICEEIDELRDNSPKDFIQYLGDKKIFNENPFSNSFFGEKKTLNSLSSKDLENYYLATYKPQNVVLGFMGSQKSKEKFLVYSRKKEIFPRKNKIDSVPKFPNTKLITALKEVKIRNPHFKRAHLLMNFLIQDKFSEEEELAYILIADIIGRTFIAELRESKSLIYSLDFSFYTYFNGPSVLEFYTECNPTKINLLTKYAKDILKEVNLNIKIFNKEKRGLIRSFEEIEPFESLEWVATRILFRGKAPTFQERRQILNGINFNDFKDYYKKFAKIEPIIVIGAPPKIKRR